MILDFMTWAVSLLSVLIDWLGSMQIVQGLSLLTFMAACFVFTVLIRALIPRA